ncbi:hypothetical protein P171DRAFT_476597 [Karstenula rhodostoma CBS 690.94]|uniref:F-box domain-containing protein n=1 Tax=Karstenula rhodostoma CBS 690.94 TaxID=1392251 RepID=A0A9P4P8S4_9PLEO|nr:hypothetical protein P171DRAFT_476597 [Karstenula rhodostoma CBS 690.94]
MGITNSKSGEMVKRCISTPFSRPSGSSQQDTIARRLTFLDLPPEIRSHIYEYCILDSEVEVISKAKMSAKPFGDPSSLPRPEIRPNGISFAEYWQQMPIDESPAQQQCSWNIEPMEIYRKFVDNQTGNPGVGPTTSKRPGGGFRAFEASYAKSDRVQSLVVNLFLANKQICQEASILFYERNHFVFNTRWEDVHWAPLAFLWDHPGAYMWMRSLHITMPDPPAFVNHGRILRGEDALPSNGRWKDLVTQIRKLRLRHFGLTISVDVTDRISLGKINSPFSAAYTPQWFKILLPINGLQSMRLLFDVDLQYTNPNPALVTYMWPSDLPAVISMAQELKDHWLSGKGSYEDAQLHLCNSRIGAGATGHRLEFVSWVKSENPGAWVFPLQWLPPSLSRQDPTWYVLTNLTGHYQREHYTRPGFDRLSIPGLGNGEKASDVALRHP